MTECVLSGRVTEDGRFELDEPAPVGPGRVLVSVTLQPALLSAGPDFKPDHRHHRKALRDSALGCVSDEEARRLLALIEEEFEQVNLDDWG